MNELKCPHCNYEGNKTSKDKNEGLFWELSNEISLTRSINNLDKQQEAYIYGCPSCKKLFVFDGWEW